MAPGKKISVDPLVFPSHASPKITQEHPMAKGTVFCCNENKIKVEGCPK
jgi:hypothetical protein